MTRGQAIDYLRAIITDTIDDVGGARTDHTSDLIELLVRDVIENPESEIV